LTTRIIKRKSKFRKLPKLTWKFNKFRLVKRKRLKKFKIFKSVRKIFLKKKKKNKKMQLSKNKNKFNMHQVYHFFKLFDQKNSKH